MQPEVNFAHTKLYFSHGTRGCMLYVCLVCLGAADPRILVALVGLASMADITTYNQGLES